jgi:N12 class adenine-specific DNA methylase
MRLRLQLYEVTDDERRGKVVTIDGDEERVRQELHRMLSAFQRWSFDSQEQVEERIRAYLVTQPDSH